MSTMTEEQIIVSEAERLYWYDSTFHAEVKQAVQVVTSTAPGRRLTPPERSLAVRASAIALVVRSRWET